MKFLKCLYKFVFYLWNDVSLPLRAAPPSLSRSLLVESLVGLHPVLGAQPPYSLGMFLHKVYKQLFI